MLHRGSTISASAVAGQGACWSCLQALSERLPFHSAPKLPWLRPCLLRMWMPTVASRGPIAGAGHRANSNGRRPRAPWLAGPIAGALRGVRRRQPMTVGQWLGLAVDLGGRCCDGRTKSSTAGLAEPSKPRGWCKLHMGATSGLPASCLWGPKLGPAGGGRLASTSTRTCWTNGMGWSGVH